MTNIHERLIAILVRTHKLAPERLGLDAPLAGLGIDSLGTIELLWEIEDEFLIKLAVDDPSGLVTVGDVVDQIAAALVPPPRDAAGTAIATGMAALPP